jgi:hypothetical protein
MSMYLPNDDVRPTGDEAAEFVEVPEPVEFEEHREGDSPAEDASDQRPNG